MCALFRSSRSKTLDDASDRPRGLRRLFHKLRSADSTDSAEDDNDGDVQIMRPRDTVVTSIGSGGSPSTSRTTPRQRRRSAYRVSV